MLPDETCVASRPASDSTRGRLGADAAAAPLPPEGSSRSVLVGRGDCSGDTPSDLRLGGFFEWVGGSPEVFVLLAKKACNVAGIAVVGVGARCATVAHQ